MATKKIVFRNYEVSVVPFNEIHENEEFQRGINGCHVNHIVAHYHPDSVLMLILVWVEGRRTIIDARHRLHVLKARGETEWLCLTLNSLDDVDIYQLFCDLNGPGKLPLKPIDEFRFCYRAGQLRELAIWKVVVEECKFHIPLMPGEGRRINTISAYGALKRVYDNYGQTAGLRQVFRVILRCFMYHAAIRQPTGRAVSYDFLIGLGMFLSRTEHSVSNVVARLKAAKVHPADLISEAINRTRDVTSTAHSSVIRQLAIVLEDVMAGDDWKFSSPASSSSTAPLPYNDLECTNGSEASE